MCIVVLVNEIPSAGAAQLRDEWIHGERRAVSPRLRAGTMLSKTSDIRRPPPCLCLRMSTRTASTIWFFINNPNQTSAWLDLPRQPRQGRSGLLALLTGIRRFIAGWIRHEATRELVWSQASLATCEAGIAELIWSGFERDGGAGYQFNQRTFQVGSGSKRNEERKIVPLCHSSPARSFNGLTVWAGIASGRRAG